MTWSFQKLIPFYHEIQLNLSKCGVSTLVIRKQFNFSR